MAESTVVGLEITETCVRGAQIKAPASKTPKLLAYGEVRLPDGVAKDSEILDQDAVALALKQLWEQAHFTTKKVVLGVVNRRMIVREYSAPYMPLDQIKRSLPFQVQDLLPVPVEQAVLDFYPVKETEGPNGKNVDGLLIAGVSEMIENLIATAHKAKLHVVTVDLAPFGVTRAAARAIPSDQTSLVIDIGTHTTYAVVVNDGISRFVRILPTGLHATSATAVEPAPEQRELHAPAAPAMLGGGGPAAVPSSASPTAAEQTSSSPFAGPQVSGPRTPSPQFPSPQFPAPPVVPAPAVPQPVAQPTPQMPQPSAQPAPISLPPATPRSVEPPQPLTPAAEFVSRPATPPPVAPAAAAPIHLPTASLASTIDELAVTEPAPRPLETSTAMPTIPVGSAPPPREPGYLSQPAAQATFPQPHAIGLPDEVTAQRSAPSQPRDLSPQPVAPSQSFTAPPEAAPGATVAPAPTGQPSQVFDELIAGTQPAERPLRRRRSHAGPPSDESAYLAAMAAAEPLLPRGLEPQPPAQNPGFAVPQPPHAPQQVPRVAYASQQYRGQQDPQPSLPVQLPPVEPPRTVYPLNEQPRQQQGALATPTIGTSDTTAVREFVMRIGNTVDFYTNRNPASPVTQIYLCGAGAAHPEVAQALGAALNCPVTALSAASIVKVPKRLGTEMDDRARFSAIAAIGVTLGAGS